MGQTLYFAHGGGTSRRPEQGIEQGNSDLLLQFALHLVSTAYPWCHILVKSLLSPTHSQDSSYKLFHRMMIFALASTSNSNIIRLESYMFNVASIFYIVQAWLEVRLLQGHSPTQVLGPSIGRLYERYLAPTIRCGFCLLLLIPWDGMACIRNWMK